MFCRTHAPQETARAAGPTVLRFLLVRGTEFVKVGVALELLQCLVRRESGRKRLDRRLLAVQTGARESGRADDPRGRGTIASRRSEPDRGSGSAPGTPLPDFDGCVTKVAFHPEFLELDRQVRAIAVVSTPGDLDVTGQRTRQKGVLPARKVGVGNQLVPPLLKQPIQLVIAGACVVDRVRHPRALDDRQLEHGSVPIFRKPGNRSVGLLGYQELCRYVDYVDYMD